MSPRRPELAGFTLLECLVAITLLSLLAMGLARLTTTHDRLLAGLEAWTHDEPTYFVAQPDGAMQRLVGMPATLVTEPPLPPSGPGSGALQVTVTAVDLVLHPPQATAQVHLEDS